MIWETGRLPDNGHILARSSAFWIPYRAGYPATVELRCFGRKLHFLQFGVAISDAAAKHTSDSGQSHCADVNVGVYFMYAKRLRLARQGYAFLC